MIRHLKRQSLSESKSSLIVSLMMHIGILLFFIIGFGLSQPLPVFENTNQHDVISAVVLGDTEKSRILPKPVAPPKIEEKKAEPKVKETPKKPEAKPKTSADKPKEDAIALKKKEVDKKKLAEKRLLESIKKKNMFGNDLLSDIKKQKESQQKQQKKLAQERLQKNIKQTLEKQAEESMRQQLLQEDIKLQGTESRQAQGEVNKYKALILQAISEQWIVPIGADKSLYCELMIRVAPNGAVLDVQIKKTSGDPSLDSSARAAVLKASPLPVPKDKNAFSTFKQFVLKVKPENILDGGAA